VSRVLLFVQTGDGRPKCCRSTVVSSLYLQPEHGDPRQWFNCTGRWWVSQEWWNKHGRNADRWWLVECENAAQGRVIIETVRRANLVGDVDGIIARESAARILASGGKVAAEGSET